MHKRCTATLRGDRVAAIGAETVIGPPKTARRRRNVYLDRRTVAGDSGDAGSRHAARIQTRWSGNADDVGDLGDAELAPIVGSGAAGGIPAGDRGGAPSRTMRSGTPWSTPSPARPALPAGRRSTPLRSEQGHGPVIWCFCFLVRGVATRVRARPPCRAATPTVAGRRTTPRRSAARWTCRRVCPP